MGTTFKIWEKFPLGALFLYLESIVFIKIILPEKYLKEKKESSIMKVEDKKEIRLQKAQQS